MARRKSGERPVFRVTFMNQGQVYEVFAATVAQGDLFGFIEVEQLLFGQRSELIVDSSEERLKTEFDGVRRVFIPMHSVVRIDEVEKRGAGRIIAANDASGNVKVFPVPLPPGGARSR
jgi:hypothetical protein